jgi:predicted DNA binding CopG/RHH family protein
MVTFELKPKDKTVSLRLPEALLNQVKAHAIKAGIPAQRFMRLALEKAVKEKV